MTNLNWSFSQVWNDSLDIREEKPLVARDNMWASELGGSYLDRYLKMKATPMTNPPNSRSLRKFEAGNLMEWVVSLILKRAGILMESQEWLSHQYPDLLKVTGKLDFVAGGIPKANGLNIEDLHLPPFFTKASLAILNYLLKEYPNGLKETILEIKSCSSFTFDGYAAGRADPKHVLQTFHYLKSKNLPEAHIIYISRDDLRICECGVFNCPKTEELYKDDIQHMTDFINNDQEPEKEKEILFNNGRFSQNYKIAYSNYLTMLYGYKEQMEYEDKYKPMISSWNRTLGRIIKGDKMTPLNLETIIQIKKTFPNLEELVIKAKELKADLSEATE